MKIETKILIVAIIMILSVGPVDYFFASAPKQLPLPNATSTATSYTLSGNVSGTIMDIKPYIYYVGVSQENSRTSVDSIIESIPEISNYSLSIMLNPSGGGYQYVLAVPLNDTGQMKRIGFRLAWRLSPFFDKLVGAIPFIQAKVSLPQAFHISTSAGAVNITTGKANYTMDAFLLYSKQPQQIITMHCPQIIASLNYSLAKVAKICEDIDLSAEQRYLGLSILDVLMIPTTRLNLTLEAVSIAGIELRGSYRFAGLESMNINELENMTGSTIYLNPSGNDSTIGNFTIKAAYTGMAGVDGLKAVFKSSNFTIKKEYKSAYIVLPGNVAIEGESQELYNMPYTLGLIEMDDEPGFYDFDAVLSIIYDEVTNIAVNKLNLS